MHLGYGTETEGFTCFSGLFGRQAAYTSYGLRGSVELGSGGKAYDPHSSWHKDGRVNHKSYGVPWIRQQRQRLDNFRGAEFFIATPVDQMLAPQLPECNPMGFASVTVVAVDVIDVTPGRQQLHVDLVEPGLVPPPIGLGERPLMRWWLYDSTPNIVVSLYQFNLPRKGGI